MRSCVLKDYWITQLCICRLGSREESDKVVTVKGGLEIFQPAAASSSSREIRNPKDHDKDTAALGTKIPHIARFWFWITHVIQDFSHITNAIQDLGAIQDFWSCISLSPSQCRTYWNIAPWFLRYRTSFRVLFTKWPFFSFYLLVLLTPPFLLSCTIVQSSTSLYFLTFGVEVI